MLRAGLVGVTGYTGMELSRILASHPSMRLTAATSRQDAGKRLDTVYPFLQGLPGADVTLVRTDDIIIDAKSGTTGAGRKAVVSSLYCEVADSFRPYNIGGRHRHTPEIEQELSVAAGESVTVSFNPHLLPISRGILATIYTKLKDSLSQADVQAMYEDFWKDAPWVRVLPAGKLPETRNVRGTMFCDIAVTVDQRTGRLLITSAIDNLCRGASGQAVANANLMFGLPVETGLNFAPLVP